MSIENSEEVYYEEYLDEESLENEIVVTQNETSVKTVKNLKNYGKLDLEKAVQAVEEHKLSAYAAAAAYHVPKSTILYKIKNKNTNPAGRVPVLNSATEIELAEWLKECQKMGDPRTKDALLNAAADLAKLTNDEKSAFKNDIPSTSWLIH